MGAVYVVSLTLPWALASWTRDPRLAGEQGNNDVVQELFRLDEGTQAKIAVAHKRLFSWVGLYWFYLPLMIIVKMTNSLKLQDGSFSRLINLACHPISN